MNRLAILFPRFISVRNISSSSYKYIDPASKFTTEQKDFYEENGYLVVKNNVSHDLIDKCHDRFVEIAEGKDTPSNCDDNMVIRDPVLRKKGALGQYQVNKLQEFIHDEILGQYCTCESVLDVVENIIGPNITAVHTMLINKPPDSDPEVSKHPIHQDLHYFPFRPPERIVEVWTAMEPAHIDNGCLFVIPGSHNSSPLYEHVYPENMKQGFYHGIQGKDHLPKADLIMEKGDTAYFHPLLMHGSYPNRTKHFRKAISCHFADSNCYFIDVRDTVQANIAKEIVDAVEKKFKIKMSYTDIWKMKSLLVRGPPGEFQKEKSLLAKYYQIFGGKNNSENELKEENKTTAMHV